MKRTDDRDRPRDRGVTWLCEEAQADGVPCYEVGRECDVCGKARPEEPPPVPRRPARRSLPRKR